jgi:hypothetical protein
MEILKKGQTVTRRRGGNATSFNTGELYLVGASADYYNDETVFEIEGTIKLVTFSFSKDVYGAYLLSKDGVNVGYVYNTYLTKVEVSKVVCNNELLIKYKDMLKFVKKESDIYVGGGFTYPSELYVKANVLEMIINDLEVK